jgi:methylmalonyl-CoA/ethylmalonyl-CoA epimerase
MITFNVHHVGFLCKNLEKSRAKFLELGYSIEQEKAFDDIRKIYIEFLVNSGYRVELIQPSDKESPMYPLLSRYKNTPYHFCYEVENLEEATKELENKGYTIFQSPEKAPCIENGRVVFMINTAAGIVELLERAT